jgi:hypothetical protein
MERSIWREHIGIEPTHRRSSGAPVLKNAQAERAHVAGSSVAAPTSTGNRLASQLVPVAAPIRAFLARLDARAAAWLTPARIVAAFCCGFGLGALFIVSRVARF